MASTLMRLHRIGCEDFVLEGVSPAILEELSQAPDLWQASQSLRDCRYAGFRPPCGLWRVTLERPKVTKGLLPRQAVRCADALGSLSGSDVPPHMARSCAACGCAVIPDGATDSLNSPRRLAGGCNTVPDGDWGGRLRRCWPLRGAQNGGWPNFAF